MTRERNNESCSDSSKQKQLKTRLNNLFVQKKSYYSPPSGSHKMPDSIKAFCRIVSLTAAKTSLMLPVSVACVKLQYRQQVNGKIPLGAVNLLWVQIKVRSINLVKPPQEILRSPVHVISAGVVREIIGKWYSPQLGPEQVHLVEEKNDAGSDKPPAVDY